MIRLEPLLRLTNGVTVQRMGRTPFGERTTYIGDLARLDVRKTLETSDGALINVGSLNPIRGGWLHRWHSGRAPASSAFP